MRANKKSSETTQGKIIYYEIGKGKKDLIFLHGLLGTPKVGLDFAEQLDTEKWRVVVPYLPGHGESFDPPKNFGFDDFTNTFEDFASNFETPVFIGHSFGASIGWNILVRNKIQLEKAVLAAPFNNPHDRSPEDLILAWIEDKDKKWDWLINSGEDERHGQKAYRGHVKPVKKEDLPTFINLIHTIKFKSLDTDIPVKIFYGLDDKMAPVIDWKRDILSRKNIELAEYPGGHYFYMLNWENFYNEILDFIK